MLEKINESVRYIQTRIKNTPVLGVILGTGLGGLVHEINTEVAIDYKDIPHFPLSTVEGHSGKLIFGKLGGVQIVAMQGRFHFYEGYAMSEVVFPVRVMKYLGINTLFVSNASGGVNPAFEVGDLMVITDHINFFPEHPLRGKNTPEFGPRFPDMSEAYSKQLIQLAYTKANDLGIELQKGIYAGVQGPTFETPAEYLFYRIAGADTVGMSTVPEVIIARHMGIPVFGISIITDLGVPGKIVEISHEEVQKVAKLAEKKMTRLIISMLEDLKNAGI